MKLLWISYEILYQYLESTKTLVVAQFILHNSGKIDKFEIAFWIFKITINAFFVDQIEIKLNISIKSSSDLSE